MKKIKAKFPIEYPIEYPVFGSMMMTSRMGMRRKANYICPDYNCKYTSRRFVTEGWQKFDFNSSANCPHCNQPLINIGCVIKIPKVGSKERKKIIQYFIALWDKYKH